MIHVLLRLKSEVPASIARYKGDMAPMAPYGCRNDIYLAWKNQPVEPYGRIIAAYGNEYPWNVPHVSVRLGVPGAAGFSVVALDELADPLPDALPPKPSYEGVQAFRSSLTE